MREVGACLSFFGMWFLGWRVRFVRTLRLVIVRFLGGVEEMGKIWTAPVRVVGFGTVLGNLSIFLDIW